LPADAGDTPPSVDFGDLMSILIDDTVESNHITEPRTTRAPPPTLEIHIEYAQPLTRTVSAISQTPAADNSENIASQMFSAVDIPQLQRESPDLLPFIRYLEANELPEDNSLARKIILQSEQFALDDNTLYHLYYPRSKKLAAVKPVIKQLAVPLAMRTDLIHASHDSEFGGAHLGIDRVYTTMRQKYYFPQMYTQVCTHIRTCDRCQCGKREIHARRAPLQPIPPNGPWERIHIDVLSLSHIPRNNYRCLLMVVDSFSHWVECFPMVNEEATTICDILYREIFTRWGSPSKICSDRGQNFLSNVVQEMCKKFNIERHYTSAYHPASNSVCERTNSTLLGALRTYTNAQTEWDKLLPGILAALRSSVSTHSTQLSPYFVLFGREMRLPFDVILQKPPNASQSVEDYVDQLNRTLEVSTQVATENIKLAQDQYKAYYDRNTKCPQYAVGDLVLLLVSHVPPGLTPKLCVKFAGPMRITEIGPKYTYRLLNLKTNTLLPSLVNANRLRRYYARSTPNTDTTTSSTRSPSTSVTTPATVMPQPAAPAPPTAASTNPTATVWHPATKLMSTKFIRGRRYYKVKWTSGHPPSWEPEENINDELKRVYHTTHTMSGHLRKKKQRIN